MQPIWISETKYAPGNGSENVALSGLENKLLFILFYFKVYPVQEVQGYVFGMGQTQAGEWIHCLTPNLFRNFREGFDDFVMEIACGLHNRRLDFRLTA